MVRVKANLISITVDYSGTKESREGVCSRANQRKELRGEQGNLLLMPRILLLSLEILHLS